jgi:DNA repair exonuclease SbcCD ATPase subunit
MFYAENEEENETQDVASEGSEVEESMDDDSASAAAPEPVEEAPPVFDWNGELDALTKADWFSKVGDDSLRNSLIRGFESKYRNFERGFTKAFQDTAARRKELERREVALRENEARALRWLSGDGDPMAEKQAEIDRLKAAHDSALQTLREEYAQSVQRAQEEWTGKYGTAERERDELRQRLEQFEYEARAAEERQVEEAVDEVESWLKDEAADVYENDDAFYAFCVLVTGGLDPEDAVVMTRAKFGPPPAPEPEPVPQAMDLMNMGPGRSATTVQTQNQTYKEMMDQMRRAAQADESAFFTMKR